MSKQKTVAVVGGGTMGQGIAQLALQAGHEVVLHDQSQQALNAAHAALDKLFARFVEKGKITKANHGEWMGALTLATDINALKPAQLVIEAIVESLEVKRKVFAQIEAIVSDDTMLATNTSSLSVTEIAAGLSNPARFLGLHFFNPAGLMPLVEVVAAVQSDAHVVNSATELMRNWGKTPVDCKDTPGFIVNRVARPFYVESFRLLEEKALTPRQLDRLITAGVGFKMGPCFLTDFIGQDVNYAVSQSLWQALGYPPHLKPSSVQGDLVAAQYLGRKTGQGFYRYQDGQPQYGDEIATASALNSAQIAFTSCTTRQSQGINIMRELDNGAVLCVSDGRRASTLEAILDKPVIVMDRVLHDDAKHIAIAYGAKAKKRMGNDLPEPLNGTQWQLIPDRPGLVVLRVLSMIINEAATVALHGIASEQGVDDALKGGVNYPQGAFAWLADIGVENVVSCLQALSGYYGSASYVCSPYLSDKYEALPHD